MKYNREHGRKLKRIGGLIFRKTGSGLKFVGKASYHGIKSAHHKYQVHKRGELQRLRSQSEKERLKADIRRFKASHKKKSTAWKEIERMFS